MQLGDASATLVVAAAEALLIIAVAVLSGAGYHVAVYGDIGAVTGYTAFGTLVALFYIAPFAGQGEQVLKSLISGGRTMQRIAMRWHVAFLLIAVVGFLTKSSELFSRGWIALFFVTGLFAVLRLRR